MPHYTATVTHTKVALRRDNSVPVGIPAPLFIICPTDSLQITINPQDATVFCLNCGSSFTRAGWIISGPSAAYRAAEGRG